MRHSLSLLASSVRHSLSLLASSVRHSPLLLASSMRHSLSLLASSIRHSPSLLASSVAHSQRMPYFGRFLILAASFSRVLPSSAFLHSLSPPALALDFLHSSYLTASA